MDASVSALLQGVLHATEFEDAAAVVLREIVAVVGEALGDHPLSEQAKVLRAMVHLRPRGGYRRLVVREVATAVGAPDTAPHLPSATAWRFVAERRCAVSIDVHLGMVRPHADGAEVALEPGPTGEFDSKESRQRLLSRSATHVLVLPLRGAAGAVDGMISVELDAQVAMGRDLLWELCGERLQLLADIAAPHLAGLPLRGAATSDPDEFLPVVGASMSPVVELLRVFARQEETILLGGPTGSGKSRMARWCHEQSPRKSAPFESLDLLTIPEELQMPELFGWRRGAFTSAVRDNLGSLARAEGGTVFLDEIDKLSLKAQAGLLRVLEERTYKTLGDSAGERRADVRFIVGTNSDLPGEVRGGRFREDLFYRVNVLPVRMPPLQERADEVPAWARYMANRRHREVGRKGVASLSAEAEAELSRSSWPGNLRQLDNIVRRAYALAMMDVSASEADVVLTGKHVERALSYEPSGGETDSLVERMREAAVAFVIEAERRPPDAPLDLDLADAFRGFVLGAAAARAGNRDDAFKLLGRASLVANRNHHKALRRELERVEALCRALGRPVHPFVELLDERD